MIFKNRKGEMTTQQIVILIVLIASFAVLLYFLLQLGFGSETTKEVCHNSVVTRGSSVVPTEVVPLDCQRSYVCITEDGSCEKMTKPIKIKVKERDEVYEALANEMSECWWMFGEGKVNYVGKDIFENLYCSICSQIAFDDSVLEIEEFSDGKIDKEEFYRYLALKNMTGSKLTYSQYLFGTNNLEQIKGDSEFGEIDLVNFQQYVLMGTVSDVSTTGWILGGVGAGLVVAGGIAYFASPAGWATAAILVTGAVAGGVGGEAVSQKYVSSLREGDSGNDYIVSTLIEADSEVFKGLECDYIVTKS